MVTKLLADGGYDCGLVGKFHLAGASGRIEPRPRDDGYRVFRWSHHPYNDWPEGSAYASWLRKRGFDPDAVAEDPASVPTALHYSSWCADAAVEFMEEERDGPWLLSVNFFDPHAPFDPPLSFLERYDAQSVPEPNYHEGDLEEQARLLGIDFQTPARRPADFDCSAKIAAYYAMIDQHRRHVRCEYCHALTSLARKSGGLAGAYHELNPSHEWELVGSYGTMLCDGRYKIVCYHGHGLGELFDLQEDPLERRNLWRDARFAELRFELLRQSFDGLALSVDLGPEQNRAF